VRGAGIFDEAVMDEVVPSPLFPLSSRTKGKKSACSVRSCKAIRDARDADDGRGVDCLVIQPSANLRAVKPKRPKAEAIRQPNLFEMGKLEKAVERTGEPKIERPYSLPGMLLGTRLSPQTVGKGASILLA
jgi:hypothetical protein